MAFPLLRSLLDRLVRLAITSYRPDAAFTGFMERAAVQEDARARVTVAVLAPAESQRVFGVDLARRGIQPVFMRIENRSPTRIRLQMVNVDPRYFTPLEAAAVSRFSILRRLSAFGAMGWLFLPVLLLAPLKLITAWLANGRMDDFSGGGGWAWARSVPARPRPASCSRRSIWARRWCTCG